MRSIGVLTSGGDAPGMNAAIRAVTRVAVASGVRVVGIREGYAGLLRGDFHRLHAGSVTNILQRGGTILGTSRSLEFMTPEARQRAAEQLQTAGIEGLIVIGGEGTASGAYALHQEHRIPTIAIPATIDNDVGGTDFTIGFDTAVNTALDAIDRIRDTAGAVGRVFFVEVMGRERGFIALYAGLSGGADAILVPEEREDLAAVCRRILAAHKAGKRSMLVVVAEGDRSGGAFGVAERVRARLEDRLELSYRVTVLGHVQRGGDPTAADRVLGTALGAAAVEGLQSGRDCHLVGEIGGATAFTPLKEVLETRKPLPPEMVHLLQTVTRL